MAQDTFPAALLQGNLLSQSISVQRGNRDSENTIKKGIVVFKKGNRYTIMKGKNLG